MLKYGLVFSQNGGLAYYTIPEIWLLMKIQDDGGRFIEFHRK